MKMHSKKSIFYTIAAIALTAVIFVTYSTYTSNRLSERMDSIETRIDTLNFFVKDVEEDLVNGVYIAGFRSLLSFGQYVSTNGSYINNLDSSFKESFLNGTINGQQLSLMKDSTFTDWANRISIESGKTGVDFGFVINDIDLNHTDPWTVEIGIDVNLSINDNKNTSSWKRRRRLTAKIDITGFEDPLYIINSNGRVTNSITKTNITSFVVNGNVANLIQHMNYSYYIAHNDSPSFLMRLEGNLGNSTYGIESLVNLEEFQQQGIALKDRSIVDYIYFGTKSTTNFRINNTPTWFRIDGTLPAPGPPKGEHLDAYQVRNITI